MTEKYNNIERTDLILQCVEKDEEIQFYEKQIKKQQVLTKSDIMEQFHCESDKALRILKMMFQMGYGNKIGKEYYVSLNSQLDFLDKMRGKEVFI